MGDKFTWTQEYKKSWDEDQEEAKVASFSVSNRYNPNRKNIIRHFHLAIDTSVSIEKSDYLPTIRNQLTRLIPPFTTHFNDMNPLSILSFMTCSNTFQKYSKVFDISNMLNVIGANDFSFLNCLRAAVEILRDSNCTRECLLVTASIGTKDSTSLEEICREIKKNSVKINIISICGEVTIFKKICEISNGRFLVPLDINHFEIILNDFAFPLESTETTNTLIKFGFPNTVEKPSLCSCHLAFHTCLYECPVCKTFVCSLPVQCPICATRLISPLHISKSYHYMYPLKPFIECKGVCRCCSKEGSSKCPDCSNVYCIRCSNFLHHDLNFCLYCS